MNEPATVKNGKKVNQRELLNGAFVAVPSNREAVITNSKGLELKFNEDQPRDENGRFASGDGGSAGSNYSTSNTAAHQKIEQAYELSNQVSGFADELEGSERDTAVIASANINNRVGMANSSVADGDLDAARENLMEASKFASDAADNIERTLSSNPVSGMFMEASFQLEELANAVKATGKSLDDYSTKSSSDSSNIDSDVSEEAKSAEEVLKAAAHIAAAIEADSAEDADSVSLKAQAMNIIVEALASEN
jgi:hypothetical protein